MKVIILSGIPGCGKSTFVHDYNEDSNEWVVGVSADHYFETQNGYKFDPTKLAQAHNNCLSCYLQYLKLGLEKGPDVIIVDNTNIYSWERQCYIDGANLAGVPYEIRSWVIKSLKDVRTCLKRNRHGVPKEIVMRMAIDHEVAKGTTYEIKDA